MNFYLREEKQSLRVINKQSRDIYSKIEIVL